MNQTTGNNEISIFHILSSLKKRKLLILKCISVSFIIGIIIAFTTPKEYRSKVDLLAISNNSNLGFAGLLQQFGGLAGINVQNAEEGDLVSTTLYPSILESKPLLQKLLNSKIRVSTSDTAVLLYNYFRDNLPVSLTDIIKVYTIGLPGKILAHFKKPVKETPLGDSIVRYTKEQELIMRELNDRLNLETDKVTGMIAISAEFPDKLGAAELVKITMKILNDMVISYRVQKAKSDFDFVDARLKEAEFKYLQTQKNLAAFRDLNQNIISSQRKSEEERFLAEYTLAFNVYNGLATQLEQARLKIQENTPIFKIINPPQIPIDKIKPKRILTIIGFAVLGFFVALSIIAFQFIKIQIKEIYSAL